MKFLLLIITIFFSCGIFAEESSSKCDDSQSIFSYCTDQETTYKEAIISSLIYQKKLIIFLGRDDCSWTVSMDSSLYGELPFMEEYQLSDTHMLINIAPRIDKKTVEPAGDRVLRELIDNSINREGFKLGYPLLVVVDPITNSSYLLNTGKFEFVKEKRETDPWELNVNWGHVPKKINAAILKATAALDIDRQDT